MESVGTVFGTATAAPAASELHEPVYGPSVPKPSSAGDAGDQGPGVYLSLSTAALQLTLQATEQFTTALESYRGAEEAATMTVFEGCRAPTPGTPLESRLDFYA